MSHQITYPQNSALATHMGMAKISYFKNILSFQDQRTQSIKS